jgi:hypothetical protein
MASISWETLEGGLPVAQKVRNVGKSLGRPQEAAVDNYEDSLLEPFILLSTRHGVERRCSQVRSPVE